MRLDGRIGSGQHFAHCIRKDRPQPNDKWHLDEVVITIGGKKFWLWRAIDADGDVGFPHETCVPRDVHAPFELSVRFSANLVPTPISEEVLDPDLAHADAFVGFLVAADKAEQARLARINEDEIEIEKEVIQSSEEGVLTPGVPVSTSLEGVSEIVLFADRGLTPQDVDELIATPIISGVLGGEDDPMVNFTIRHWIDGDEMESFGLRPRRVNINEYNALIGRISRFLDHEPEIVR